MSGTITLHEPAPEPLVSGLRTLGHGRTVSLLEWEWRRKRWHGHTVGRHESNDIRLPDTTVSDFHATIELAPAPGSLLPAFRICDRSSKNGTCVSRFGPRGPFIRVPESRLEVGQHLRLGATVLAVVDWASTYPLMTASDVEFVQLARHFYGSDWSAARYLGLSVARVRQVLARRSG